MSRSMEKITLTEKQAELVLWACVSGLQQLTIHLRHDSWDAEMTKKERYKAMWSDRDFQRAINLLGKKLQ